MTAKNLFFATSTIPDLLFNELELTIFQMETIFTFVNTPIVVVFARTSRKVIFIFNIYRRLNFQKELII